MFEVRDGRIHPDFAPRERGLLAQIPSLLESTREHMGDPGYDVLHRPVYPHDVDSDTDLADLVASDIAAERYADRSIVAAVAGGERSLTREEGHAFLRAVNEARLVLAARAGAFEPGVGWEDRIDSDPTLAVVAWLGYVQSELIEALSESWMGDSADG